MALVDARTTERFQATLEESSSNSTTAMIGRDNEVMNKTTPTVVPTKNGPD